MQLREINGLPGAGFFIGDGAGVGKGRQIGGIIMDNYARGRRRAVWLSTSTVSALILAPWCFCLPEGIRWIMDACTGPSSMHKCCRSHSRRVPLHCRETR